MVDTFRVLIKDSYPNCERVSILTIAGIGLILSAASHSHSALETRNDCFFQGMTLGLYRIATDNGSAALINPDKGFFRQWFRDDSGVEG
jgi:hypothetical protein